MAAPRVQFYHPAAGIDVAARGIERCIRRAEGMALVVGPPGTGKSLLLSKIAEQVRDDFDVALLSGASVCTRRALWQSVLAAIGEPYRGIDEADLRIAVVERIRGLAATGSGLVILVDEANTLPARLLEELRLLTNVPTPLPAVHIVLAGVTRLEELIGQPRMESLSQRIAVRCYLEPLDHAETLAYLRAQVKIAGLSWEQLFAAGCDDAVYRATEGVPRLINQLCDQALVLVAECDRQVTPADIATAWREIQRLPAPLGLEPQDGFGGASTAPSDPAAGDNADIEFGDGMGVLEFGAGGLETEPGTGADRPVAGEPAADDADPWNGPDVEFVFDHVRDPFAELFAGDGIERVVMQGPDDFRAWRPVASREGHALGQVLATIAQVSPPADRDEPAAEVEPAAEGPLMTSVGDDSDVIVIEDDPVELESARMSVSSVRPGDYRSLFTRLRRGDAR